MTHLARRGCLFLWSLLLGCQRQEEVDGPALDVVVPEERVPGGPLVLMVSLDTVRADALSIYADTSGWGLDLPASSRPVPRTPVLDGLAESGLRFRWALSHAPTTLASHTSVFSGRDMLSHGIYRNGVPLAEDLALVTEEVSGLGYETIAIIGSSVLDSSMGLDRGFDFYDDAVQEVVRART